MISTGAENTWHGDPAVRYEPPGLRVARVAATLIRELYNREGILHLVRSHGVLAAEADQQEAMWDAVLRFLAEQPEIRPLWSRRATAGSTPTTLPTTRSYLDVPEPAVLAELPEHRREDRALGVRPPRQAGHVPGCGWAGGLGWRRRRLDRGRSSGRSGAGGGC